MDLKEAKRIADDFNDKYEQLWNKNDIEGLSGLYTSNSILVGYKIVVGKIEISKLLQSIFDQGWTKIHIKTIKVELFGNSILTANEYQAIGSDKNKGEMLNAKSTQVLTKLNKNWLTAMHTAT